MKTDKQEFGFAKVISWSIGMEIGLILIQLIYLQIHNWISETQLVFDQRFVRNTGFFVFLGVGFVAFMILSANLLKNIYHNWFYKMLAVFIVASVIEIAFYIIMLKANYEGVFLYSVLDKFLGVLFGIVIYNIGVPRGAHSHTT